MTLVYNQAMVVSDSVSHRSLEFQFLQASFAAAAVTLKAEHTHVHCTVSMEESVPGWMKGKQTGWINAEYALLPGSTPVRSKRDRQRIAGRTMEIQRLIGRALRQSVDLSALKERTLLIDCDILQADGGHGRCLLMLHLLQQRLHLKSCAD